MYTVKALIVAVIIILAAVFSAVDAGADALESREIIIGAGPMYYDAVLHAAAVWNETGVVTIGVQRDCRAGDIHVCHGPREIGVENRWIAAFQGDTISVYLPELFSGAVACHEVGHALGLVTHYEDGSVWHERNDYDSCMAYNGAAGYAVAPDADDVQWLLNVRHGDGTGI